MKNYNEIADNVLLRRDEYYEVQKEKRKKYIRISSFVSCFIVVAVLVIGIWQGDGFGVMESEPAKDDNVFAAGEENDNGGVFCGDYSVVDENNNNVQEQAESQTTVSSKQQTTSGQNSETPPDGGNYSSGGNVGNELFIPSLPLDKEIKLTGEAITDAEAQEYFNENKGGIIGSLSSSGVSSDSVKISEKGYCHVNYSGEEGQSFEVRQNYRDYLVYNGDELIAIITLYKENGEIFNTPSFGAKWFDDYNDYLKSHKGEKLVYAYAGWFEIIVAPDNTYFNPMGTDVSKYLDGIDNPYEMFYHEAVTYIP